MNLLVTIYIPTFNRLKLLKRALSSVLNQTYKNLDIIVIDDNSNDGTKEYLSNMAIKDNRVRYFLKDKNSGASISRNIAIREAKGYFITGLDDDDYFESNRIEEFIKNWKTKPLNTVALASFYKVNTKMGIKKTNSFFRRKILRFDDLLLTNEVGNQVFSTTEFFRDIRGFDESLKCWQDLELWLRILKQGNIYRIKNYSYVIDVSHDVPRIGNSRHAKYITSYNKICRKLNLNKKQRTHLFIQTFNCEGSNIKNSLLFKAIIRYPSLKMLKLLIKETKLI